MRLPDLVAYQAAVQHPSTAFADPDLRSASVATGRLGLPRAVAGNFAVTYQLERGGRRWAVRCFHRDAADRPRRYAAISQALASLGAPFVPVTYLPLGVRVGQTWYPVTKMAWLDGVTFDRAVEGRLATPAALAELERRFIDVVGGLRRLGLAHGDLQHGNMLVEPSGALRLVDYDGMYVPALRGLGASESGDPNYQHPGRRQQFDAELDRFSALVIVVALRALAVAPTLWTSFNSGDNLLFRRADFVDPARSALFAELGKLAGVRELAKRLAEVCRADYAQVPLLDDFLRLPRPSVPAPAPVVAVETPLPPLHVRVLNRLYGAPRPAPSRPAAPTPKRPAAPAPTRSAVPAPKRPAAPAPKRPAAAAPRSWQLRRAAPQHRLAFSSDGALLLGADAEGSLRARERTSGRTRYTWRRVGHVLALACSPDAQHVATVDADGRCSIWRLGAPAPLRQASFGPATLASVAWRRQEPVVASAGNAPGVGLLDLASGQSRRLAVRGTPRCLALSTDGAVVAVGSSDGSLRCWSVATASLLLAAVGSAPVTALAISSRGTRLASAGPRGGVQLWEIPGGRALHTLATPDAVVALAFGGNGRHLAAAGRDGGIRVWEADSGRLLHDLHGPSGSISSLACSPDGRCVAATTLDGVVWLRVLGAPASAPHRPRRTRSQPAPPPVATADRRPSDWLRQWLKRVAAVP